MRIYKLLLASIIYLVLLFSIYYIHITFFLVDVLFYSAIFDGIVATLLISLIILFNSYFSVLRILEKVQMIIILFLIGYIFSISIPTVIDRSLSFYILEKLDQRGGAIKLSSFDNIIKNEYMNEHRLVDIRITEQQNSGTIYIEDGCVKLTDRGKKITDFSLFFRKNFLPKKRLIMDSYTDELTNPFRKSKKAYNYICK